jgi:hypothetical protein
MKDMASSRKTGGWPPAGAGVAGVRTEISAVVSVSDLPVAILTSGLDAPGAASTGSLPNSFGDEDFFLGVKRKV